MPAAFRAASPSSQARLPPSRRTTATEEPSISAGSSSWTSIRVGLPIRKGAPEARAARRSVSAVDNSNTVLSGAVSGAFMRVLQVLRGR